MVVKCSKCGAEISPTSRFCQACGQPVASADTQGAVEFPKRPVGVWAALTGLCIVVAIILIILKPWSGKVTQATRIQSPQQVPIVRSPSIQSPSQPNILNTEVRNTPVEPTNSEKPEPPADVVAYLDHLSKVEKMRQDITAKELNDLVEGAANIIAKAFPFDEDFDESSAPKDLSAKAEQFSKEWQNVSTYFLQVQPPPACHTLAGNYYDALREFITFMNSFQDAAGRADLAKLKEIKRDQVRIDQKLSAADQELERVCKQFDIPKQFSIKSDTGQTPLLGF